MYQHGGDIYSQPVKLDFSSNINYLGMPESVRNAAKAAAEHAECYPDPEYRSLRRALAKREWEMGGCLDLLPEHILVGNGASEILYALSFAYRPAKALLAVPSFYEYEQSLRAAGCEIERFFLREEENFAVGNAFLAAAAAFIRDLRADASSAAAAGKRGMIVLANPNNPTGMLLPADILRSLLALCRENRVLLVLDESFLDFLNTQDRELTFSGAVETAGNPCVFVLRSFTKIYAMPGLRFGYAICSDADLLSSMREVMQPWNVSLVAQDAAIAASSEYAFVRRSAREISFCRRELSRLFRNAGYTVFPSSANFILIRAPEDLALFCKKRGYLIRDCRNFAGLETSGKRLGYFRVCIRSSKDNNALLQVFCERAGLPSKGKEL